MLKIDLIAVIVAGVASMGFGMLWYGPLFGKKWSRLMGFDADKVEEMKKRGMIKISSIAFITELITAYVLSYLIALTGSYALPVLASLIFWLWIGFSVPILIGATLWEGKPFMLFLINATLHLASLSIMGLIIVYWTSWF
ncbi:DUF1761 domain-containing protein [Patescibacteria group bacterium]|nr:DUF1761 domain-containing protein [Patescibacteria group bacterium]